MSEWQSTDIAPMPKDAGWIIALVGPLPEGDRFGHLSGRAFIVKHMGWTDSMGFDLGWTLFPGMSVGEEWFSHWMRLPSLPAPVEGVGA